MNRWTSVSTKFVLQALCSERDVRSEHIRVGVMCPDIISITMREISGVVSFCTQGDTTSTKITLASICAGDSSL